MNNYPRGVVGTAQHKDWLSLVSPEGPFLSIPVLNKAFPNGVDRPAANNRQLVEFMDALKVWRKKKVENHEQWIKAVLLSGAQWDPSYVRFKDDVPATFEFSFAEHDVTLKPWAVLFDSSDLVTAKPVFLVMTVPIGQELRAVPQDGWAASPVDRLARLLRRSRVQVGVVTDGRWWALVWADASTSTASAVFDSLIWNEEQLLRDAFTSLVGVRRQVGVAEDERLPSLFQGSLLQQEEITDTLGKQVRNAVELLVQSFSESRIAALSSNKQDPLPASEKEPYEAAVTVMMRIVFLLFAEERDLLPVDQELYGRSYGVSGILDELEEEERRDSTSLDRTSATWHRVLATSLALYEGVTFEDMRMPAYGGSLFDPHRFPWLYTRKTENGLCLVVRDRVMLHVLRSIQIVRQNNQARRISFREVDVEQIGYVYEGLLGYASKRVDTDAVLSLQGADGEEPEISLSKMVELRQKNKDDEKFIESLLELIEKDQPAAKPQTKSRMANALKGDIEESTMRHQLGAVTAHDESLIDQILPFVNLLRRDLRGLPYVVPRYGIVVTETSARKNAGAHYTPRSLAEEVVFHTLEPLVYSPGPLQDEDPGNWVLKSSVEILNLTVADIAVGSGAFLVAAARYLAARLVEAWKIEGANVGSERELDPDRPFDPMMVRALREVVARCLYGADINPMAVEMCKLSLWLISLDPARPFSFLDDKIMLGNSLLGLTSVDQLSALHIHPDQKHSRNFYELFNNVDEPIAASIRLRNEISASPVDDSDVHRSAAHKATLLRQAHSATEHLRELADAVVATGLSLGGKKGKKLDIAYGELQSAVTKAFPSSGQADRTIFDRIVNDGLTPEVKTDYEKWKPLHWVLEAPQVMERGGFDAIVGNPPFLVSKKVSGAVGSNVREWFVNVIAETSGNGDLIAYFFRRAAELTRLSGYVGLIGAKAIAEGDSLQVGIEPLSGHGWNFYRVDRNRPWPIRNVGTSIAVVWMSRIKPDVMAVLDGLKVGSISSMLRSDDENISRPGPLNRKKFAFKGNVILGEGFYVPEERALELLKISPDESEVLRPILNANELNSIPSRIGPDWVIDMRGKSEKEARKYSVCWDAIEKLVKPERLKLDPIKYPRRFNVWWQHGGSSQALYEMKELVDFLVVVPITSKNLIPARVSSNQIFSSALAVCPVESFAFLALVSSWMHRSWAQRLGTKMRNDFRYTITDCFDTFPFLAPNKKLEELGESLDKLQWEFAKKHNIGLTRLYNRVNDVSCSEHDIQELRQVHEKIDREVIKLFGFSVELGEFEISVYEGLAQWGPPAGQRIEILQLLLAENQRQQREGVVEWQTK